MGYIRIKFPLYNPLYSFMEEIMKTITLPKLKTLKGYDENDNEIITFDNVEIKSLEVFKDISKVANSFGVTIAEFTN